MMLYVICVYGLVSAPGMETEGCLFIWKFQFCRGVPSYKVSNSLILALSTMSNRTLFIALTLQSLAWFVFTAVYVNADLGAGASCQPEPLHLPERLRVDTASDFKLSQMVPSLRKSRRQLSPVSASLAMTYTTAGALSWWRKCAGVESCGHLGLHGHTKSSWEQGWIFIVLQYCATILCLWKQLRN